MKREVNERQDIKRKEQKIYLVPEHKAMLRYLAREKGVSVSKYVGELIQDEIVGMNKKKGGRI